MPLSFRELESYDAGLSTREAVALVVAAIAACEKRGNVSDHLPDSAHFVLASDGTVSLTGPVVVEAGVAPVAYFAALLRGLLRLARADVNADHPGEVPGALLLLIARASGDIDLPSPSLAAFRDGLTRFQRADPALLRSVYVRISRRHDSSRAGRAAVLLIGRVPLHRTAVAASLALAILAGFLALNWTVGPSRPLPAGRDRVTVTVDTVTATVVRESPAPAPTVSTVTPPDLTRNTVAIRPVLSRSVVGADVFSPSFARDGRTLLFHTGRTGSVVMEATFDQNGLAAIAPLVDDGATNYHASVSPDGRWLAYDSDRDGTRGVYLARVTAGDTRKVSGDGYAAVPRWSSDGRQVAFTRAEPAHPQVWNVWVFDLPTGSLRRISHHTVGQAWGASWFPDGRRLAYSVEDTLVIVNLEDGTRQTYEAPRKSRLIRTPAVSPDGTRIVFQVYRDGVWILDLRTGRMRRVLTDRSAEEFAWSPDGSRVVFHTKHQGAWSVWELQI